MRRQRDHHNSTQILKRIENLDNTPLYALSVLLRDLLVGAQMHNDFDSEYHIGVFVQDILDRLPKNFGDRFFFDAFLIQSTLNLWSTSHHQLSNTVIPAYSTKWGYETPIFVDAIRSAQRHRVDLIRIPIDKEDEIPFLANYPWLFHELGHYLISKYGGLILDPFRNEFNKLISKLKMRTIADRGIARTRADGIIEEISARWLPVNKISEPSWLRELVVDEIALWSLGPAYLGVYEFDHKQVPDPFQMEQDHPPVELRTRILIEAGEKLGWIDEVQSLKGLVRQWKQAIPEQTRNNYISLSQNDLVGATIATSMAFCSTLEIPRMSQAEIEKINTMLTNNDLPEDSTDIIVGAWLLYKNQRPNYEEWESSIYKSLVAEIRQ